MCREAVEIQEGWEPKSGDKIINQFGNEDIITFINGHPHHWRIGTVETTKRRMLPQETNQNDLIYLPRQEDLQRIFRENTCINSPGDILFDFLQWFYLYYENKDIILDSFSITTIWLCFVMETVYGKRWNGETWEAINVL